MDCSGNNCVRSPPTLPPNSSARQPLGCHEPFCFCDRLYKRFPLTRRALTLLIDVLPSSRPSTRAASPSTALTAERSSCLPSASSAAAWASMSSMKPITRPFWTRKLSLCVPRVYNTATIRAGVFEQRVSASPFLDMLGPFLYAGSEVLTRRLTIPAHSTHSSPLLPAGRLRPCPWAAVDLHLLSTPAFTTATAAPTACGLLLRRLAQPKDTQ